MQNNNKFLWNEIFQLDKTARSPLDFESRDFVIT